jgi:hypothetical protein
VDDFSRQFAPILSIECQRAHNVEFSNERESDGQLDKNKLMLPIECYYFNQSLNFFEPLLEKTQVDLTVEKQESKNQNSIRLEFKKLVNINFSVAFYDSMFNLNNNLKLE